MCWTGACQCWVFLWGWKKCNFYYTFCLVILALLVMLGKAVKSDYAYGYVRRGFLWVEWWLGELFNCFYTRLVLVLGSRRASRRGSRKFCKSDKNFGPARHVEQGGWVRAALAGWRVHIKNIRCVHPLLLAIEGGWNICVLPVLCFAARTSSCETRHARLAQSDCLDCWNLLTKLSGCFYEM